MKARFPERTYDVGIAEQHAVVFACGLAIAGYRPVCAIYSTFLQRAFDPIIHDVAIQEPAGRVRDRPRRPRRRRRADPPRVFDLAYLRAIPGLTVMAPMDEAELVDMLHTALRLDGPVAFRYPRGADRASSCPSGRGRSRSARAGSGVGRADRAGRLRPRRRVAQAAVPLEDALGARPTMVNARFCKPIDTTLIRQLAGRHDSSSRSRTTPSWRASGAPSSRSWTTPRPGPAPRHPRPVRRPRQARAAARRGRPVGGARRSTGDRGANDPAGVLVAEGG